MTSIRRKLLFTLLAALLAAGFSAAAATFFSAQAEFNDFLDAHLRETAESLADSVRSRSEERRVGKECRSRWSPYH